MPLRIGSFIQLITPSPGIFLEDFETGWLTWIDFGDPIFIENFNIDNWLSWLDFGAPIFTENFENGGW